MSDRNKISEAVLMNEAVRQMAEEAKWRAQFKEGVALGGPTSDAVRAAPQPRTNPDASYNPERMQGLYAFPQQRIESMPNPGLGTGARAATPQENIMHPQLGWAGTEYQRQNEPSFEGQWSGEVPL